MGNSASKAARALPKKARTPPAAAAGKPYLQPPSTPSRPQPIARETKDSVIDADGKDPQFLANLSKLGQVSVNANNAATATRTSSQVAETFRARDISERQASSGEPVRNHMPAASLAELLDDRKLAASKEDIEQIARRYNIDVDVLQHLVGYVNTPSVGEGSVVRTVAPENGAERITMKAVWIEPNINRRS